MDRGTLFLETFFKGELIARYLPDIVKGMWVTVEVAAAVVVSGIALGLALAVVRSFRLGPLNALIVVFAPDIMLGAAPARAGAHRLFRPAQCRAQPAELCGVVAGAVAGARGLRRGDLLGRYPARCAAASGRPDARPA